MAYEVFILSLNIADKSLTRNASKAACGTTGVSAFLRLFTQAHGTTTAKQPLFNVRQWLKRLQ
jgi:hypothetical protein